MLSPRPPWVPAGTASTTEQRVLAERFMECFAAFLSYTDAADRATARFPRRPRRRRQHPGDRRLRQRRQLRRRQGRAPSTRAVCRTSRAPAWTRCTGASTRSAGRSATTTTPGDGPWPATRPSSDGSARCTRAVSPTRASSACPPAGSAVRVGGVRRQFAHAIDVLPTVLELVGVDAARGDRRDRPVASRRHQLRLPAWRRGETRARPARHPALRDARVAGHLPRRLEGGDLPPGRPDLRRRTDAPARPSTTTSGSCTTSPRTSPRPTTSPPNTRRRSPSWSRCGGRRRAATTCSRSTTGCSRRSPTSTTAGGPSDTYRYFQGGAPVPEWVAVDVRNRSHT